MRRGLLQKTVALELGLDTGVLCGIEKGVRGPLDSEVLTRAAQLFQFTDDEMAQLRWSAHHDRLIGLLVQRGATKEEVELISASLHAWHYLGSDQRTGLLANVRRIGESAQLVSALAKPQDVMEVAMT